MLGRFAGQHVLLLQGPAGPFFQRVARTLTGIGAQVTKVNLNAGDELFYRGPSAISYRGTFDDWPKFLTQLLEERGFDCMMLFGQCRPYHREAIALAKEHGVEVFVFEEGYIRPDFVTLEKGGVNGHSSIPRDPEFYRGLELRPLPEPTPVGNTFWHSAMYASLNSTACTFFPSRFPHYQHHRDINAFRQASLWFRATVKKLQHSWRDRNVTEALATEYAQRYFLLPLQVANDSQISHSRFGSMAEFLETVVRSFAEHAPPETLLVVKDHPMDRPYSDHSSLLREFGDRHGVRDRVWHVDTIHLPTVLKHARGIVVINSTVGLSSLYHGTPTKCLGTAVYDVPGLTHQGPLDEFWIDPGQVDGELEARYRWWLRKTTQLSGSVWSKLYEGGTE